MSTTPSRTFRSRHERRRSRRQAQVDDRLRRRGWICIGIGVLRCAAALGPSPVAGRELGSVWIVLGLSLLLAARLHVVEAP